MPDTYDIRASEDESHLILTYEGKEYKVNVGYDFLLGAWCRLRDERRLHVQYPHNEIWSYTRLTDEERAVFDEEYKQKVLQVVAKQVVRYIDEVRREYDGRQNI